MTETKHLSTTAVLKDGDGEEGRIEAIFSTFGVVDKDGDVVEAGAIPHDQETALVWAHDWSRMIGKGRTRVDDQRAIFDGHLFLNTTAGKDAYETMRGMQDLMQFSWGFKILDADWVERDGQQVRSIRKTALYEVSPVLIGAGEGTQLLSLKHGQPLYDHADALSEAVADFVSRVRVRTDYRAKEGRTLSSANRERLQAIAESLSGAAGDLTTILKDTEPAKAADIDALWANYMVLAARQNGIQL